MKQRSKYLYINASLHKTLNSEEYWRMSLKWSCEKENSTKYVLKVTK